MKLTQLDSAWGMLTLDCNHHSMAVVPLEPKHKRNTSVSRKRNGTAKFVLPAVGVCPLGNAAFSKRFKNCVRAWFISVHLTAVQTDQISSKVWREI